MSVMEVLTLLLVIFAALSSDRLFRFHYALEPLAFQVALLNVYGEGMGMYPADIKYTTPVSAIYFHAVLQYPGSYI